MSKRRNRKGTPNIPQDMLERARRQIAEQEATAAESSEPNAMATPIAETQADEPATRDPAETRGTVHTPVQKVRPRRREGVEAVRLGEKKFDPNDPEQVRRLLESPTKVVTEDELRREYSYVVSDLKGMAILAAGLFIALVILAQLL
jgi:hypothetical protein